MSVHPSLAQLGYMQGGDGSSLTASTNRRTTARCNAANDCRCGVDPPPGTPETGVQRATARRLHRCGRQEAIIGGSFPCQSPDCRSAGFGVGVTACGVPQTPTRHSGHEVRIPDASDIDQKPLQQRSSPFNRAKLSGMDRNDHLQPVSQNTGHKVRRPRAARACDLCRVKKNKCDELYPCTYCKGKCH